jgi:hypothetical protein
MKIIELLNAIRVPITNEESEVLSLFDEKDIVLKSELSPRSQILANSLVNKNILSRKNNDEGKLVFKKKIR